MSTTPQTPPGSFLEDLITGKPPRPAPQPAAGPAPPKVNPTAAQDPDLEDLFERTHGGIFGNESKGSHWKAPGVVKTGPPTRSGARAVGVGQVMPDRGETRYRTVGGRRYDLYDEAQNREASRAYLREGFDATRKRADRDPAIGAAVYYFGGPGAHRKYMKRGVVPEGDDRYHTFKEYVFGGGGLPGVVPATKAAAPRPKPARRPASFLDDILPRGGHGAAEGMGSAGAAPQLPPTQSPIPQPPAAPTSAPLAPTPKPATAAAPPEARPEVPGLLEPGNIDLAHRPVVHNPEGTISTVRSMSFGEDGREILVPTVSDDGRILTEEEAIAQYRKTSKHLGVFSSPEAATAYAQQLHEEQARLYARDEAPSGQEPQQQFERLNQPGVSEALADILKARPAHDPAQLKSVTDYLIQFSPELLADAETRAEIVAAAVAGRAPAIGGRGAMGVAPAPDPHPVRGAVTGVREAEERPEDFRDLPQNDPTIPGGREELARSFDAASVKVPVGPDDTAETLARKVLDQSVAASGLPAPYAEELKRQYLASLDVAGMPLALRDESGIPLEQKLAEAKRAGSMSVDIPAPISDAVRKFQRHVEGLARDEAAPRVEAETAAENPTPEYASQERRALATERQIGAMREAERTAAEQPGGWQAEAARRREIDDMPEWEKAARAVPDAGRQFVQTGLSTLRGLDELNAIADRYTSAEVPYLKSRVGPFSGARLLQNLVELVYAKSLGKEFRPTTTAAAPEQRLTHGLASAVSRAVGNDEKIARTFYGQLAQGVGSSSFFILTGALLGPAGIAASGAGAQADEINQQFTNLGITDGRRDLATLAGGVIGLSELWGLGGSLERMSEGRFSKEFVRFLVENPRRGAAAFGSAAVGKEMLEESLQEFFQSAAGQAILETVRRKDPDVADRVGRVLWAGASAVPAAALTAGLMTAPMAGLRAHGLRGDAREAAEYLRARGETQEAPAAVGKGEENLSPQQAEPVTERDLTWKFKNHKRGKIVGAYEDNGRKYFVVEGGNAVRADGRWDRVNEHFNGGAEDEAAAAQAQPNPQEQSKEFKSWAGGLPVINAGDSVPGGGAVVRAYHGTRADFSEFDPRGDIGPHLGSQEAAEGRLTALNNQQEGFGPGSQVMPVFVRLRNPLTMPDMGRWHDALELADDLRGRRIISQDEYMRVYDAVHDEAGSAEGGVGVLRSLLESKGYDGIVYHNEHESRNLSYIPFHPGQIKSATGNRGSFDPESADVTHKRERQGVLSYATWADEALPTRLANFYRRVTPLSEEMTFSIDSKTGALVTNHAGEELLRQAEDHKTLEAFRQEAMRQGMTREEAETALQEAIEGGQLEAHPFRSGQYEQPHVAHATAEVFDKWAGMVPEGSPGRRNLMRAARMIRSSGASGGAVTLIRGNSDTFMPGAIEHESLHKGSAVGSGYARFNERVDVERLLSHRVWSTPAGDDIRETYPRASEGLHVEEMAAALAEPGGAERLGVDDSLAEDYLFEYFTSFVERNGRVSVDEFRNQARHVMEVLERARREQSDAGEPAGRAPDRDVSDVPQGGQNGLRAPPAQDQPAGALLTQGPSGGAAEGQVVPRRVDRAAEGVGRAQGPGVEASPGEAEEEFAGRIRAALGADESTHQAQRAPVFRSQLRHVVEEKLPARTSGAQALALVTNPQSGVKAEELKWTGFDDFLRGRERVTREEALRFLNENEVRVEEVEKGRELTDAEKVRYDELTAFGRRLTPEETTELIDLKKRFVHTDTKFSQYTLPGAKEGSYRELLLTLPVERSSQRRAWESERDRLFAKYGTKSQIELERRATKEEFAALQSLGSQMGHDFYKSSHFDEPNILAHIRFNERTDAEGKRVLFVEEIQSDWHQEGRKKGYGEPEIPTEPPPGYEVKPAPGGARYGYTVFPVGEGFGVANGQTREAAIRQAWLQVDPSKRVKGVTDAPFKKNWHELAMKRILRHAAENGYDRVAWTTGETQAARYDLSKHISRVLYAPQSEALEAFDLNGKSVMSKKVPPAEVEAHVGKEVAQKLFEKPLNRRGEHFLAGIDLKVGGEGMKGFYDRILPSFAQKYGRKWGAKVGETEISVAEKKTLTAEQLKPALDAAKAADDNRAVFAIQTTIDAINAGAKRYAADFYGGSPVRRYLHLLGDVDAPARAHSIDITDSMRRSVMEEGQPLFQKQNDAPGRIRDPLFGSETHQRAPEQPQLIPGGREPARALPGGQVREGAEKTSDVRQPALARDLEPFERRYDSDALRAGSDGRDYRPAPTRFREVYETARDEVVPWLVDLLNAPRSLMSSGDVSAPLRQGAILTLSDWKLTDPRGTFRFTGQAMKSQFKAFSRSQYEEMLRAMAKDSWFDVSERMGLDISNRDAAHELLTPPLPGQQTGRRRRPGQGKKWEEAYASELAANLWWVGSSERAYTMYLDVLRFGTWKAFADEVVTKYAAEGKDVSSEEVQKELKAWARFINAATGRSDYFKEFLEGTGGKLFNGLFFAPKYALSRWQVLNPVEYARMPPLARRRAVERMGKYLSTMGMALGLLGMAGAKVEWWPPDDADWLKVKFGNWRYDGFAGLQQPARMALRLINFAAHHALFRPGRKDSDQFSDVELGYIRAKLSPPASMWVNWREGKAPGGDKFSWGATAVGLVAPMSIKETVEQLLPKSSGGKGGGAAGAVKTLPGYLGVGVQNYSSRKKKSKAAGGGGESLDDLLK